MHAAPIKLNSTGLICEPADVFLRQWPLSDLVQSQTTCKGLSLSYTEVILNGKHRSIDTDVRVGIEDVVPADPVSRVFQLRSASKLL